MHELVMFHPRIKNKPEGAHGANPRSGYRISPLSALLIYWQCRYVECELPPDVIVNIGEARFHLHKVGALFYFLLGDY